MKGMASCVLLLFFMMPCLTATEWQTHSVSIEDLKAAEAVQKAVLQIRHDLQKAISSVKDSELDELEAKLKAAAQYKMNLLESGRHSVIPVLLAGVKRRPKVGAYLGGLMRAFRSEESAAENLDPEQRKEHYLYPLTYLQEAAYCLQPTAPDQQGNDPLLALSYRFLVDSSAHAALEAGALIMAKGISQGIVNAHIGDDSAVRLQHTTILGRIALRQNDLESAKRHLLDSVPKSSSTGESFYMPTFALARELLEKEQKEIVIKYLELIAPLWKNPKIPKWKEEIRSGKIPSDGEWR
jgi:hypothetical protein